MNPKIKKTIIRYAIGIGISALIGQIIKMEKKIEDRLDDHFDESKADQTDQTSV